MTISNLVHSDDTSDGFRSIPTADQIPASEFEFIIPKGKYEMVKDAMYKSKSSIFVKCDESKKFARAEPDMYQ